MQCEPGTKVERHGRWQFDESKMHKGEEADVGDIEKVINPKVVNSVIYGAMDGWMLGEALCHPRLPSSRSTSSTPLTPWTLFHSSSIPTISTWFASGKPYMHSALWGWQPAFLGRWVRRCRFHGVYIALLYTLHEVSEHSYPSRRAWNSSPFFSRMPPPQKLWVMLEYR